MARMRAEWLALWADVDVLLGRLMTERATEARRKARARAKEPDPAPQTPLLEPASNTRERARAKFRQLRAGPGTRFKPATDKEVENEPTDSGVQVSG